MLFMPPCEQIPAVRDEPESDQPFHHPPLEEPVDDEEEGDTNHQAVDDEVEHEVTYHRHPSRTEPTAQKPQALP
jgi:hypothetical protein